MEWVKWVFHSLQQVLLKFIGDKRIESWKTEKSASKRPISGLDWHKEEPGTKSEIY